MRTPATVALLCTGVMGCGGDGASGAGRAEGKGGLEVTAYGEAFVEEGIPAEEVNDGWAVHFTRFLVTFRDITIAGEKMADPEAVDLTRASEGIGQVLGRVEVPAGSYTDASFTIAQIQVVGSAHKEGQRKTFDWTLQNPTRYHDCETRVEVKRDGVAVFQITVHADHLLYDSLVSTEPALGFQALADADTGDGVITRAELEAVDIGGFDPGSEDVDHLWGWLNALVGTLGHADGEGHCHAEPTT